MTKYAKNDLLTMQAPYDQLSQDESFLESSDSLNQLSENESIAVVTQIILQCPKEKRADLSAYVNPIRGKAPYFAKAFENGLAALKLAEQLNSSEAYTTIISPVLMGLFHQFSFLVHNSLPDPKRVAQHLIEGRSAKEHSAIARKLHLLQSKRYDENSVFSQIQQEFSLLAEQAAEARPPMAAKAASAGLRRNSIHASLTPKTPANSPVRADSTDESLSPSLP
jgi:hypothetical protein